MGEKIKVLSHKEMFGSDFEIELNKPVVPGQDCQIHFQSDKIRFEMTRKDFFKYALSVLVAEKNLRNLKNLKTEDVVE